LISKGFESELRHCKPSLFSGVTDQCPASVLLNPRGMVGSREEQAIAKLTAYTKQVK